MPETKQVVVKPEHLAAALEFRKQYPSAGVSVGCVMNRALREAFPEHPQHSEYPLDSAIPDGSKAHACGSASYETPNGDHWFFDTLGTAIVKRFDAFIFDVTGEFGIELPATVTLTKDEDNDGR